MTVLSIERKRGTVCGPSLALHLVRHSGGAIATSRMSTVTARVKKGSIEDAYCRLYTRATFDITVIITSERLSKVSAAAVYITSACAFSLQILRRTLLPAGRAQADRLFRQSSSSKLQIDRHVHGHCRDLFLNHRQILDDLFRVIDRSLIGQTGIDLADIGVDYVNRTPLPTCQDQSYSFEDQA